MISPGPWMVSGSGVSVDAGETRIRQEAAISVAERQANARLIAAAPDLLDAVDELIAMIEDDETDLSSLRHLPVFENLQRASDRAHGYG